MTSHLHLLHLDSHDTMIVLNDVKIVDLGLQCMVIFSVLGEVLGAGALGPGGICGSASPLHRT